MRHYTPVLATMNIFHDGRMQVVDVTLDVVTPGNGQFSKNMVRDWLRSDLFFVENERPTPEQTQSFQPVEMTRAHDMDEFLLRVTQVLTDRNKGNKVRVRLGNPLVDLALDAARKTGYDLSPVTVLRHNSNLNHVSMFLVYSDDPAYANKTVVLSDSPIGLRGKDTIHKKWQRGGPHSGFLPKYLYNECYLLDGTVVLDV